MRRIIALIKDDPNLMTLIDEMERKMEVLMQRNLFLMKQADSLKEEANRVQNESGELIDSYLISTKRLDPHHKLKKEHVHVDLELGAVVICDGEDHKSEMPEFLKKLLNL